MCFCFGCHEESKDIAPKETKIDADGVFSDTDCDCSNSNVSSLETYSQYNNVDD